MQLLAEEKIVWTVPAPAWARKIVRELPLEKRQARKEELAAKLPLLLQYRFTFGSVNMREESARERIIRQAREVFEAEYGISPQAFARWFIDVQLVGGESGVEFADGDKHDKDHWATVFTLVQDMTNWATIISCLKVLESRQVKMLDDTDEPVWEKTDVPESWKTFDKFMEGFPRALFRQCVEVCNDLNPGVWTVQMDDDSKNFGGVNVRG